MTLWVGIIFDKEGLCSIRSRYSVSFFLLLLELNVLLPPIFFNLIGLFCHIISIACLEKLLRFFLVAEETPLVAAAETDNDRDHREHLQLEGLVEVVALLRPGHRLTVDLNCFELVVPAIWTEFIIIKKTAVPNDG